MRAVARAAKVDAMALLARLKALLTRRRPMRRPGTRQATSAARKTDLPREDALRAKLVDDPNDMHALRELAELVRRRADSVEPVDPLIAEHEPADRVPARRARPAVAARRPRGRHAPAQRRVRARAHRARRGGGGPHAARGRPARRRPRSRGGAVVPEGAHPGGGPPDRPRRPG